MVGWDKALVWGKQSSKQQEVVDFGYPWCRDLCDRGMEYRPCVADGCRPCAELLHQGVVGRDACSWAMFCGRSGSGWTRGFLVGRFRESMWYFECAIMLRKFLVVAAVTLSTSCGGLESEWGCW